MITQFLKYVKEKGLENKTFINIKGVLFFIFQVQICEILIFVISLKKKNLRKKY